MFPMYPELQHKYRHKELLREAEQYRLVQLAKSGQEPRDKFYLRVEAWLGEQMITLGSRLKEKAQPECIEESVCEG